MVERFPGTSPPCLLKSGPRRRTDGGICVGPVAQTFSYCRPGIAAPDRGDCHREHRSHRGACQIALFNSNVGHATGLTVKDSHPTASTPREDAVGTDG